MSQNRSKIAEWLHIYCQVVYTVQCYMLHYDLWIYVMFIQLMNYWAYTCSKALLKIKKERNKQKSLSTLFPIDVTSKKTTMFMFQTTDTIRFLRKEGLLAVNIKLKIEVLEWFMFTCSYYIWILSNLSMFDESKLYRFLFNSHLNSIFSTLRMFKNWGTVKVL